MTQVEQIKQEIEEMLKCYQNSIQALEKDCYADNVIANYLRLIAATKIDVCREILDIINSHSKEEVSEELEQAFCHYAETIDNYPSNQDEEKYMYNAFQAGAQWQRKHMLKAAVEGTLSSTITGSEQTVWAYAGYGEYGKDGDKVKLLILEDDE